MIANAMVDIWLSLGYGPIPKYEDDLKPMCYPVLDGHILGANGYCYNYDLNDMKEAIANLNVPWHPEKGTLVFASRVVFIGYEWDLEEHWVALPEAKHLKFLYRVQLFVKKFCRNNKAQPCTLIDIQQLHCSLCHVAFVYLEGHTRLPSLSNFAIEFSNRPSAKHYPPRSLFADLDWWIDTLNKPSYR